MANFFIIDTSFNYKLKNSFSADGQYNENWTMIKLVTDKNNQIIAGNFVENLYTVLLSKCFDGWEYRLMDFVSYQNEYKHKNVIISIEKKDFDIAKSCYIGHINTDKELRSYEAKVLVHSTTKESWNRIKECGILKSWKTANRDGDIKEKTPIGHMLGDPIDFRDYIMLGGFGYHNEVVVASKQKGELCYDCNVKYTPGARIYLDASKIASDGLLVRDGIHLKIRDNLELKPYMLWASTPYDFDEPDREWTPLKFSQLADELFKKQIIHTWEDFWR